MILTATQVTQYATISASAATIAASGLIEAVQETIPMMINNYFTLALDVQGTVTFNATARSILSDNSFVERGFVAGYDIYIYNSYLNDGYFTIESISDKTIVLASGQSVIDELSGRSVLISMVQWPLPIKRMAAKMIAYDYDYRDKNSKNIKSHSLGPFSESYTSGDEDDFGYPRKITDVAIPYRVVRLM